MNSNSGPILPWLRTIDAFDTHDDSIQLVIAGGITSVQVLPGSINAIGKADAPALRDLSTYDEMYYSRSSIYDEAAPDGGTFADFHDHRTTQRYQWIICGPF